MFPDIEEALGKPDMAKDSAEVGRQIRLICAFLKAHHADKYKQILDNLPEHIRIALPREEAAKK